MSKLFIIGNGFDVAHELPTEYKDFHEFLRNEYPEASEENYTVPFSYIGRHGEDLYDKNEVVGYLMNLISRTADDLWKDFEESLGHLSFEDDFSELSPRYDHDGDENLFHEAYDNEDLSAALAGCVPQLSDFFSDWVNTIDISSAKIQPKFYELIDHANDYFLSFNYTLTLEKLYKVKDVCHIHGKQGEEIIFGHGAGPLFDKDNFSRYIGSETGLESIQSALRKDTTSAIEKHQDFFKNLNSSITEIYSYGFSFGKVDKVYLEEIFKNIDTTNIIWYLNDYKPEEHPKQKQTILECGFKGSFGVFSTRD